MFPQFLHSLWSQIRCTQLFSWKKFVSIHVNHFSPFFFEGSRFCSFKNKRNQKWTQKTHKSDIERCKIFNIKVKQLQPQFIPLNLCLFPLYFKHAPWCCIMLCETHIENDSSKIGPSRQFLPYLSFWCKNVLNV